METKQIDSTIDVNTYLENAIPTWEQRRLSHVALAKAAREERDRFLASVLGSPGREFREKVWRAGELEAQRHEFEAEKWAQRIKTAQDESLLLFDGDPSFQAEFAGLLHSCKAAGRQKFMPGGPFNQLEWAIQIPFNVIQAWGV